MVRGAYRSIGNVTQAQPQGATRVSCRRELRGPVAQAPDAESSRAVQSWIIARETGSEPDTMRTIVMDYTCIRTETRGAVGLVVLDRPKVLNALNRALIDELGEALAGFDTDDAIGAMVVTGNEKAFAAGADISEMVDKDSMDMFGARHFEGWERIEKVRKPVIAAVAGYALGGGCELAMACDIIIAADNARFGQPEIRLGVLPGLGGTQRLPRIAGKAKAMDMCLTARMMNADEAERSGLVSRVVPLDRMFDEALEAAAVIASMSRPAVLMVKEAIDRAYETTLESGLDAERGLFNMSFSTADKHEGMRAFLEKRAARWSHR